ncbi:uncharacterized protein H6S33_012897 [Morchella sextelata]|uniref:uncharacterized protein n=1 Tax=Morchella sextelata TaxID=1174677 RepID=UPI001D043E9A|nr:uncharacterized protein H6S33_012897 [Morchella sextelata]KAH0609411.1 hypothetical protein H6S33_012897 [Morchella sextelata]
MADTTPTPTARPARPPLPQLLCPLTRYGPHRHKPKPKVQAQPLPDPPPSPAATYPGDTMRIDVTADERVVSVEQFDCPQERSKAEEHKADNWVEVTSGDGEAGEELFDVIALDEERGGSKTLLKDSEVERVMLETERDVEVFVEMVRAQGRRLGRLASMVGLGGWVKGKKGSEKGSGEEEEVKGRWGP